MTKNEIIESYYRENRKELVAFARKRVGNYCLYLAEEAVQEAFYRSLKYYRSINTKEHFKKWFGRILVNSINDIKAKERDRGVTHPSTEHYKATEYSDGVEYTKEVVDELSRQKPRNADILNMYFFDGFKSPDIAKFVNVSSDVVRDVVRTFRKRIRSERNEGIE